MDGGITCEAPSPIDPIMVVMVVPWRIEGILTEADTHMRDGNEMSWWQLTGARPSLATLKQARLMLLTRIKRYSSGHRLSKCRKGELTNMVWRVIDKCILLFPCEWEKEEWNGPPVEFRGRYQ